VGKILRLLAQYLTGSNHLTFGTHTEVVTATWNRKRKNQGDEERDQKSEDRDWASIPSNPRFLDSSFFICKMRELRKRFWILPAPKPDSFSGQQQVELALLTRLHCPIW